MAEVHRDKCSCYGNDDDEDGKPLTSPVSVVEWTDVLVAVMILIHMAKKKSLYNGNDSDDYMLLNVLLTCLYNDDNNDYMRIIQSDNNANDKTMLMNDGEGDDRVSAS